MLKKTFLAMGVLTGCLLASAAQAQVITFSEFTKTTPGPDKTGQDSYAQISTAGFEFINDCEVLDACLAVWDTESPWQMDPGGAAVFNNYGYTTTTLQRVDGRDFDLRSIDLADVYNIGTVSTVEFTFHYVDGSSSTIPVELDDVPGPQTALFNQKRLTSVSWRTSTTSSNGWCQFDNVNVTPLRLRTSI